MLEEIAVSIENEAKKYCDNYEVYIEKDKLLELDIHKNTINFAKEEANLGFSIRMIEDGKIGFAFSSDMNKINDLAQKAYDNLKINEEDYNFSFSNPSKFPKVKKIYDSTFHDFNVQEAIEVSKLLIDTTIQENCEPSSGGFYAAYEESFILNSNGVECFNKSTGFGMSLSVNAEKDSEKSTAYDGYSSCLNDLEPVKFAKNISNLAKDSIGGEAIETANVDVVLDYHAVRGLLSTFINAFNADNVLRGRSIYAGKIDKKVVSDNISLYDDGALDGGLLSAKCDGEGVPSQKTPLIEKGVLKGFIYDIYNSNKSKNIGMLAVESTGNGVRPSYSSVPSVSTSNILLKPLKELKLDEIKEGIYVNDILGAHTANPISGDFSVEANNSFIIKNGEKVAPVKKAMLSGNIFEALKDCTPLKSEIHQHGSFIIPKLVLHNLKVLA